MVRRTREQFIEEGNTKHNNKYDYSLSDFKTMKKKVTIICPLHGNFEMTPEQHIGKRLHGCQKCGYIKCGINGRNKQKDFIKRVKKIHNSKYSYEYIKNNILVIITCPQHGDFNQTPNKHLQYQGCPKCNCSKGETKTITYLEDNNIKYLHQKKIKFLDRILIFDFYIPSKKLFIEYDGKQHFTDWYYGSVESQRLNDDFKNCFIAHKNYNLLRIHYKDFKNIKDVLDDFFSKKIENNLYFSRDKYYT